MIAAADAIEQSTRRTLVRGGGLLVLGLAVVGVGAPAEGGPIALAGLLGTIYAIHRFGRLGPDDALPVTMGETPKPPAPVTMGETPKPPAPVTMGETPKPPAQPAASYEATDAMWLGGLALLAGVSFVAGGGAGAFAVRLGDGVVVGGDNGWGAYTVLLGGAFAFAWGFRGRGGVATGRPAAPEKAKPAAEREDDADASREPRPAKRRRPRRQD